MYTLGWGGCTRVDSLGSTLLNFLFKRLIIGHGPRPTLGKHGRSEQAGDGEMEKEEKPSGLCIVKRGTTGDLKAVPACAPWEMVNDTVHQ